jgi:adenine-specific DNA-methyltransferase
MVDTYDKLKELLFELFRFETSDLNFGLYRILNAKREQLKKFVEEDLRKTVEVAFEDYARESCEERNKELEEVRTKIKQDLGPSSLASNGDLKEEFRDTPLGKQYYSIKTRLEEQAMAEEMVSQVFNDLYCFFSRYYEEGDFVPQYRQSIKQHKYVIPYNGEEVKLYWANFDQYYIKTGTLFRDYTFCVNVENISKVIFQIVSAEAEVGPKKGTKTRFFILDNENPVELQSDAMLIRFQYRELTTEEEQRYKGKSNFNKQRTINQKIYETILKTINDVPGGTVLSKNEFKQRLLYHLSAFTAKNTKDYFIHKRLGGFLSEQLDAFVKSEVLSVETLLKKFSDKHIIRAKMVKGVGEKIIAFLAQVEDFQKRLWEKKKFVLKTGYVITLDRIPQVEQFLDEIIENKQQLKEWSELGIGTIVKKSDLIAKIDPTKRTYKKFPIDTRYFSEEFQEALIENLTETADLDDLLDGLLVKSENWQALTLLLAKYGTKVQTIYIDPPFNKKEEADYLYQVKFKDSTWIAMLENRLRLAQKILDPKGSIFVRCDYNGNMYVRLLMNEIFGEENFRNEITVRRGAPKAGLLSQFKDFRSMTTAYDNLYWFSAHENTRFPGFWKGAPEEKQLYGFWVDFQKGKAYDRPTMRYEILGIDISEGQWKWSKERALKAVENYRKFLEESGITNETLEQYWIRTGKSLEFIERAGDKIKYWVCPREELLIDNNWLDVSGYSSRWGFQTENAEILLKRAIESTSDEGDLIMDFFLGSGTTTAVAHKLKRKWIGVEMGEHFYAVILPRMKKVLAGDSSGISKEVGWKGGGFFKYVILEQYEDALDNIEFAPQRKLEALLGEDYLLKYFLDFETRGSNSLLNIEALEDPFNYRLKVNLSEAGETQEVVVDLLETFNYLLGLKVKKVKARVDNGRKYKFIFGEMDGQNIVIVWRKYNKSWTNEDFKRDAESIIKEISGWMPSIVYVNGQSNLKPHLYSLGEISYIEPEFRRLMEIQ